eukprot:GFYU01003883.1.p1 GENE.GFYU01003883.1~~GFYU01003883.1.p1  ORF type:complete len:375 (-),score=45.78 GFYU01003883.1:191-1315(-)
MKNLETDSSCRAGPLVSMARAALHSIWPQASTLQQQQESSGGRPRSPRQIDFEECASGRSGLSVVLDPSYGLRQTQAVVQQVVESTHKVQGQGALSECCSTAPYPVPMDDTSEASDNVKGKTPLTPEVKISSVFQTPVPAVASPSAKKLRIRRQAVLAPEQGQGTLSDPAPLARDESCEASSDINAITPDVITSVLPTPLPAVASPSAKKLRTMRQAVPAADSPSAKRYAQGKRKRWLMTKTRNSNRSWPKSTIATRLLELFPPSEYVVEKPEMYRPTVPGYVRCVTFSPPTLVELMKDEAASQSERMTEGEVDPLFYHHSRVADQSNVDVPVRCGGVKRPREDDDDEDVSCNSNDGTPGRRDYESKRVKIARD